MAKKSKSVFRQPGARKFQLVHRSQRDPLIHDPDASQHVFKPINVGKGKAKAEPTLDDSTASNERGNFGEAALYGIYYDDSEYDYMQHLRPVGVKEDGVESTWIEASSKPTKKEKSFLREDIDDDDEYGDLPLEARPSKFELTRAQAQQAKDAIPEELMGLQPDMDPHLRQALEALDDEAFVVAEVRGTPGGFDSKGAKSSVMKEEPAVIEDGSEQKEEGEDILEDADDFFAELVKDGEREEDEEVPWDFREEGAYDDDESESWNEEGGEMDNEEEDWQGRFKRFQIERKARQDEDSADSDLEFDARSEAQDTVGQLPKLPVIGGKRRRKGTSDASGYSMSRSSMFRNEGLTALDEHFDQVEKDYMSDEDEEEEDDDDENAPELLESNEHFNAIMDDFLDNYEILGRKMLPIMPGETPVGKLGTLREAMRDQGVPIRIENGDEEDEDSDDLFGEEDKADKWDCETILSTYSNLENHPKVIRVSSAKKVAKIAIDPKTGLPSITAPESKVRKMREAPLLNVIEEEEAEEQQSRRVTITRPKAESKEEKKARKQAVKDDRQARRSMKKATTKEFANERKSQLREGVPAKGVRRL